MVKVSVVHYNYMIHNTIVTDTQCRWGVGHRCIKQSLTCYRPYLSE